MIGEMMYKYIIATLLLLMLAACSQEPTTTTTNTTGASPTIIYETYGGFVPVEMATQKLVITQDKIVYTVYAGNGSITRQVEKPMTQERFQGIVDALESLQFSSLNDRYDSSQPVADVGYARITYVQDGTNKSVEAENIPEFLPQRVGAALSLMQNELNYVLELDDDQLKALAQDWIMAAPTYAYDGSDLQFVDHVRRESYPVQHVLTYTFTSNHGGYGDRSDMITTQVITDHTIELTIVNGQVISAIIDGEWDEMVQEPISAPQD